MGRSNLFVAGLSASLMLAATAAWANDPNTRSTQPVADTVITTKVKTELAKDDQTKARHINVETKDGVVRLSGLVDSDTEKQQAEADAQTVEGVVSVKNNLKVKQR